MKTIISFIVLVVITQFPISQERFVTELSENWKFQKGKEELAFEIDFLMLPN